MISILIPTYNYNTVSLVKELHLQASNAQINFEIIVGDDCSNNQELIDLNQEINQFDNATYFVQNENLGRGNNINSLVNKAQYDWILLLDCDLFPRDSFFISNYLKTIHNQNVDFIFGGIAYTENLPHEEEMLRWVFGNKREALSVLKRKKSPYKNTLTSNIFVKKSVLLETPFHSILKNYGFEDLVLMLELEKKNIKIEHIDNPLFHLKLEKSLVFIEKYQSSLKNLKLLIDSNIVSTRATKISQLKEKVDFFPLNQIILLAYKLFEKKLIQNLTSKKPKLYLFDFYRLGYFLKLYHSK